MLFGQRRAVAGLKFLPIGADSPAVRVLLLLLPLVLALNGQESPQATALAAQQKAIAAQHASVEKMHPSVETQKNSVRRQVEQARPALPKPPVADGPAVLKPVEPVAPLPDFFTIPWTEPMIFPTNTAENNCPSVPRTQLSGWIQQAADREGLSTDLLHAVINKESAYQPCAVSSKGAMGLMQLMPQTADSLNVQNPFNPKENIDGGSHLLRSLLDRYGNNLALALGAYNAGPGAVDRSGGVPAYPETQRYVSEILSRLQMQ